MKLKLLFESEESQWEEESQWWEDYYLEKQHDPNTRVQWILNKTILASTIVGRYLPGTRLLKSEIKPFKAFLEKYGGIVKMLGSGVEGAALRTGDGSVIKYFWPEICLEEYEEYDPNDDSLTPDIRAYQLIEQHGPFDGVVEVFETYKGGIGPFSFGLVAMEYLDPVDNDQRSNKVKRIFAQSPIAKKLYSMIGRGDPSDFYYSGWSEKRKQWVIFDLLQ